MQSGYKNCKVRLMLKTGKDRYYHKKFEKDTWQDAKLEVTRSRFSPEFWLKNFSNLHERVRLQVKECLDSKFVPSWLTRGRTSLGDFIAIER